MHDLAVATPPISETRPRPPSAGNVHTPSCLDPPLHYDPCATSLFPPTCSQRSRFKIPSLSDSDPDHMCNNSFTWGQQLKICWQGKNPRSCRKHVCVCVWCAGSWSTTAGFRLPGGAAKAKRPGSAGSSCSWTSSAVTTPLGLKLPMPVEVTRQAWAVDCSSYKGLPLRPQPIMRPRCRHMPPLRSSQEQTDRARSLRRIAGVGCRAVCVEPEWIFITCIEMSPVGWTRG